MPRFALRDQVVQDYVGAANRCPRTRVIAEAVQKVEDGIGLLAARVVPGRRVSIKVAIVAHHSRLVEMMMNLAMGHRADFPGKGRRPRHMNLARSIKEVGLYGV